MEDQTSQHQTDTTHRFLSVEDNDWLNPHPRTCTWMYFYTRVCMKTHSHTRCGSQVCDLWQWKASKTALFFSSVSLSTSASPLSGKYFTHMRGPNWLEGKYVSTAEKQNISVVPLVSHLPFSRASFGNCTDPDTVTPVRHCDVHTSVQYNTPSSDGGYILGNCQNFPANEDE